MDILSCSLEPYSDIMMRKLILLPSGVRSVFGLKFQCLYSDVTYYYLQIEHCEINHILTLFLKICWMCWHLCVYHRM